MTLYELEDALVEFIGQNTSELRYRSNEQTDGKVAPRVYSGFIPRDEVGSIIPGEITTYPAIIIGVKRGQQSWDSETVTVEVIIGCFDDSLDQQGYSDVVNLVQRLKERLRFEDIIRERFPIRMPLQWEINRKASQAGSGVNAYPYWFGEMQLTFEMEVATSQYDAEFTTGDLMEGTFRYPNPNSDPNLPT